jgi:hypothetical protein
LTHPRSSYFSNKAAVPLVVAALASTRPPTGSVTAAVDGILLTLAALFEGRGLLVRFGHFICCFRRSSRFRYLDGLTS